MPTNNSGRSVIGCISEQGHNAGGFHVSKRGVLLLQRIIMAPSKLVGILKDLPSLSLGKSAGYHTPMRVSRRDLSQGAV
jgi:hypothetical protein